jgi:hypothetical protein
MLVNHSTADRQPADPHTLGRLVARARQLSLASPIQ